MSTGLKIILSSSTAQKVEKILAAPQTKTQRKITSEAKGLYAFYQAKWQKSK